MSMANLRYPAKKKHTTQSLANMDNPIDTLQDERIGLYPSSQLRYVNMYIYIYIYVYMYVYIYIYDI